MTFLSRRPRLAAYAAWAFCLVSAGFAVAGTALNLVIGDYGDGLTGINKWSAGSAAMGVTMSVVGALIASRRPENPVGWILCAIGFTQGLDTFITAYAVQALIEEPGSLPGGVEAAWMSTWEFAPGITLLLIFLPLLFPDGRLLSPRWRIVAWLGAVELFLFTVPLAVTTWSLRSADLLTQEVPEGAGTAAEVAANLQGVGLLLALVLAVAAVVSVVKRYRGADGHERLQLKWFAYAVAAQVVVSLVVIALPETSPVAIGAGLIWSVLIPAGVGIAILRHRLYGIDVLINRTLVYVPLTAILAGLFVASTSLVRTLFTDLTDTGSDASVAISTISVVALLTPLKNKLQALVDRHFKEQLDPLGNLRKLTGQAESVVAVLDMEDFAESVLKEISAGFGADGAAVEIGGASRQRSLSYGHANETQPILLPLEYRGEQVGTLKIWASGDNEATDGEVNDAARQAAAVLAKVIALTPGQNRTPAGVEAAAKAAVR